MKGSFMGNDSRTHRRGGNLLRFTDFDVHVHGYVLAVGEAILLGIWLRVRHLFLMPLD
jgi:hypothetical protein